MPIHTAKQKNYHQDTQKTTLTPSRVMPKSHLAIIEQVGWFHIGFN
ncbi:MAG: hypothetical protein K2W97_03175 [Chthoniobacterales bacterium]|nr:hypothetical protein [Chthoniobacterales bacterium]